MSSQDNKKSSANGASGATPEKIPRGLLGKGGTPVTKSTRLPTVRAARDLTLGGAQRKSFKPNIPARVWDKPTNSGSVEDKLVTKEKRIKKEKTDRPTTSKGHGRGQAVIIQSQSIFESGPTEKTIERESIYGSGGAGGGGSSVSIGNLDQLLADDSIDDGEIEDITSQPVALPLLNPEKYKEAVKVELKLTEDENINPTDPCLTSHIIDCPPDSVQLVLVQPPDCLPGLLADADDARGVRIKSEPSVASTSSTDQIKLGGCTENCGQNCQQFAPTEKITKCYNCLHFAAAHTCEADCGSIEEETLKNWVLAGHKIDLVKDLYQQKFNVNLSRKALQQKLNRYGIRYSQNEAISDDDILAAIRKEHQLGVFGYRRLHLTLRAKYKFAITRARVVALINAHNLPKGADPRLVSKLHLKQFKSKIKLGGCTENCGENCQQFAPTEKITKCYNCLHFAAAHTCEADCGSIEEETLKNWVLAGHKIDLVKDLYQQKFNVNLSRGALQRRLKWYGIRYSQNEAISDDDILAAIRKEQQLGVFGYRRLYLTLRAKYKFAITRARVVALINAHDLPKGTDPRLGRRLHLKPFLSKGPNHLWSVDGHEKLARPFGLYIYGILDTFSRKVLALHVLPNKIQATVGEWLIKEIRCIGGLPQKVMVDTGTEWNDVRHLVPIVQMTSVYNQEIKAFWGQLIKQSDMAWYQNTLRTLENEGYFDRKEELDRWLVWRVFSRLLQNSLNEYKITHNSSRIRQQVAPLLPTGYSPNFMWENPAVLQAQNYLQPSPEQTVSQSAIGVDMDRYQLPNELTITPTKENCRQLYIEMYDYLHQKL